MSQHSSTKPTKSEHTTIDDAVFLVLKLYGNQNSKQLSEILGEELPAVSRAIMRLYEKGDVVRERIDTASWIWKLKTDHILDGVA